MTFVRIVRLVTLRVLGDLLADLRCRQSLGHVAEPTGRGLRLRSGYVLGGESPAPSSALSQSQYRASFTTFPPSSVHTDATSASTAAPLPLPRPLTWLRTTTVPSRASMKSVASARKSSQALSAA